MDDSICSLCDGTEVTSEGLPCKCKFESILKTRFPELISIPKNTKFLSLLSEGLSTKDLLINKDWSSTLPLVKSFVSFSIFLNPVVTYRRFSDTDVVEAVFYDDPSLKMSHLREPTLLIFTFQGLFNKTLPNHIYSLIASRRELGRPTWFLFQGTSVKKDFARVYGSDLYDLVFNHTTVVN